MTAETLDDWVCRQDDLVESFRAQGGYYEHNFPVVPNERTNWLDELRASHERVALADLSHHMTAIRLSGPDVVAFLERLCVNDFDDFDVGRAKQVVLCNHRGHLMGDGPLLRLGEDEFYGPGIHASKWIAFNLETGDWDVEAAFEPPTPLLDGDPERFVFQVQGPDAHAVLGSLTDADLDAIGFYRFADVPLAGYEVRAFGHGMSPAAGFELHGPFEHEAAVRSAVLDAGRPYGLRELGSRTYVANSVRLGWVAPHPRPVYDGPAMAAYRRWATGATEQRYGKWGTSEEPLEATFSFEGSYASDDVRDYYLDPIELGYGKLVDWDHDFVGRDALRERADGQRRTLVSLMWDPDDVNRVNTSIVGPGEPYKVMDNLPRVGWARQFYDAVTRDGELVGISHGRSYQWDVRGMVSLCRIDLEHADPGTEVEVVWGDPGGRSPNPTIPDHAQTTISATVATAPYTADERRG